MFLLKVQEYEKQIQVKTFIKLLICLTLIYIIFIFKSSANFDVKVSIYENILKESVDTIQLIRDELKLDPV